MGGLGFHGCVGLGFRVCVIRSGFRVSDFRVGLRVFFDFRVGFKVLCFIMLDAFAFFVQGSGLLIFGWGLGFHVFA